MSSYHKAIACLVLVFVIALTTFTDGASSIRRETDDTKNSNSNENVFPDFLEDQNVGAARTAPTLPATSLIAFAEPTDIGQRSKVSDINRLRQLALGHNSKNKRRCWDVADICCMWNIC